MVAQEQYFKRLHKKFAKEKEPDENGDTMPIRNSKSVEQI